MNSDSKPPEAGLSDDADISPALLSGQEHEDGDGSCENSDDEYVLEDTDDDDYYESEYAISNSSRGGGIKSQNELAAAGNGSDELKAFRAEWLQNLKLSEGIQGQDVKGPEQLPCGGGQGDEDNSDGLSVSRLWLGDDYNCYEFEDQPSSGNRVTLGHEMDEFEQEQLLQEEMWKYYAENRNRNGQSNVPRYYINNSSYELLLKKTLVAYRGPSRTYHREHHSCIVSSIMSQSVPTRLPDSSRGVTRCRLMGQSSVKWLEIMHSGVAEYRRLSSPLPTASEWCNGKYRSGIGLESWSPSSILHFSWISWMAKSGKCAS